MTREELKNKIQQIKDLSMDIRENFKGYNDIENNKIQTLINAIEDEAEELLKTF
jgi:gas vesicle protein